MSHSRIAIDPQCGAFVGPRTRTRFTRVLPACNCAAVHSWRNDSREPSMQHSAAAQQDGAARATHSPLGRLGGWAADHGRTIAIVWCGVVLVLGALAPVADRALSGAGWEALDSESVAARQALEAHFPGRGSYALSVVIAGSRAGIDAQAMRATLARVEAVLRSDAAVAGV